MGGKKQNELFEEAYRQYSQGIFRFTYFKVSDYEMARDLTGDTFVRFWKQISGKKTIENNRALLYAIARGLIIDYYRKNGKRKNIPLDNIDERLLGRADRIEDELSRRQELEEIFNHLKQLKNEYQEVILLHYIEDLKIPEIALILKKKKNAVRVLLHRALKSLKEII